MLAGMDVGELLDWVALAQIEPWGETREDMRWKLAQIYAGVAAESDNAYADLDYLKLDPAVEEEIDPEESLSACRGFLNANADSFLS